MQDGFELPQGYTYETIRKEDLTDKFIRELCGEAGNGISESTMRLYLENVCPLIKSQYNRDVFLNGEILRFRIRCEQMMTN